MKNEQHEALSVRWIVQSLQAFCRLFTKTKRSDLRASRLLQSTTACLAISLLHSGCHDREPSPTQVLDNADTTGLSTQVKFLIELPFDSEPRLTPGKFTIPPNPEHFFVLRDVNQGNVQSYVREINRTGIQRIQFSGRREGWVYPPTHHDQPALLRRICQACPNLTAISLKEWKLSLVDLAEVLQNSNKLQELDLNVCYFPHEQPPSAEQIHFPESQVSKLRVRFCYGFLEEHLGALLHSMPEIESLSIADWRDSVRHATRFTGETWPLKRFSKLRELTIETGISDDLVRQVFENAPQLSALWLGSCRELTGTGLSSAGSNSLRELDLVGCPSLNESEFGEWLGKSSGLRSLKIQGCNQIRGSRLDLAMMTELRSLEISGKQLDVAWIVDCCQNLRQLETLKISHCPSLADEEINFSNLIRLNTLKFDGCLLPADALDTLPRSLETLIIHQAFLPNEAIAKMLGKQPNLRELSLHSITGGREFGDAPNAINRNGWDFRAIPKLTHLDLRRCRYLTDDVIRRISSQLPQLEELLLEGQRELTGNDWNLDTHPGLQRLRLFDLPGLKDDLFQHLPSKLQSLHIRGCHLHGKGWDLAACPSLENLTVRSTPDLLSIGAQLPRSLKNLVIAECPKFQGKDLDYSNFVNLRHLAFHECHEFDVDRMFRDLPNTARQLRSMDLTACPAPSNQAWDLAPLGDRLEIIRYEEGDPSFMGGADERSAKQMQGQLPQCKVFY